MFGLGHEVIITFHYGSWSSLAYSSCLNYDNEGNKINYHDIYSADTEKCSRMLKVILSMWDLENGKNEMRAGC